MPEPRRAAPDADAEECQREDQPYDRICIVFGIALREQRELRSLEGSLCLERQPHHDEDERRGRQDCIALPHRLEIPRFARNERNQRGGPQIGDEERVEEGRGAYRVAGDHRIEDQELPEDDTGEPETDENTRPPDVESARSKPVRPRAPPPDTEPDERMERELEQGEPCCGNTA